MSKIITFYSYKGGVGRTMALANIAVQLAKWGSRVLIVDWDLEAPGLEHFFSDFIDIGEVKKKEGVIELLDIKKKKKWRDMITGIRLPDGKLPINFIAAGKRSANYFKKVRTLNVDRFYKNGGGQYIEQLREQWKAEYDFVLIDSRTGITEIGGICTVQLPDIIVLLFTATQQGFDGSVDVAKRILTAQQDLPYGREKLIFLPVVTKFDTQTEFQLSRKWISIFTQGLSSIYRDWLPVSIKIPEFLETTKVPYVAYFSFGEKLPVLEQSLFDPSGLAYAYENLAALLANQLQKITDFLFAREKYILSAENKSEIAKRAYGGQLKVFISYAFKDQQMKHMMDTFIAPLISKYNLSLITYDNLRPGESYSRKIVELIKSSSIFIPLISPEYMESQNAQTELMLATENDLTILPVLLRKTNLKNTVLNDVVFSPRRFALQDNPDYNIGFTQVIDELEDTISEIAKSVKYKYGIILSNPDLISVFIHEIEGTFEIREITGASSQRLYYSCELPGRSGVPVNVIAIPSMSEDNIALKSAYQSIREDFDAEILIFLGFAGGIASKVTTGDVIIANELISLKLMPENLKVPSSSLYMINNNLNDMVTRMMVSKSRSQNVNNNTKDHFNRFNGSVTIINRLVDNVGDVLQLNRKLMAVTASFGSLDQKDETYFNNSQLDGTLMIFGIVGLIEIKQLDVSRIIVAENMIKTLLDFIGSNDN